MANMPTCTAGYRNPLTDNKTSVWSLQPRAVESLSADLQWQCNGTCSITAMAVYIF